MRIYLWPQKYNKGYFRLYADLAIAVSGFEQQIILVLGASKERSLKATLVTPPSWKSACKVIAGRPLLLWLQQNGWPHFDIEVEVCGKGVLWLRRKGTTKAIAKRPRTLRQREYDERNQAAGALPDAHVPGSKLRKTTKNVQHK